MKETYIFDTLKIFTWKRASIFFWKNKNTASEKFDQKKKRVCCPWNVNELFPHIWNVAKPNKNNNHHHYKSHHYHHHYSLMIIIISVHSLKIFLFWITYNTNIWNSFSVPFLESIFSMEFDLQNDFSSSSLSSFPFCS